MLLKYHAYIKYCNDLSLVAQNKHKCPRQIYHTLCILISHSQHDEMKGITWAAAAAGMKSWNNKIRILRTTHI